MRKYFANHISNKELVFTIYKDLSKFSYKNKNIIRKWAKDMKRHFKKKDIQTANKHMKNVHH